MLKNLIIRVQKLMRQIFLFCSMKNSCNNFEDFQYNNFVAIKLVKMLLSFKFSQLYLVACTKFCISKTTSLQQIANVNDEWTL